MVRQKTGRIRCKPMIPHFSNIERADWYWPNPPGGNMDNHSPEEKKKINNVANQKEGMAKNVKSKMLNHFSLRVPSIRPLQIPTTTPKPIANIKANPFKTSVHFNASKILSQASRPSMRDAIGWNETNPVIH